MQVQCSHSKDPLCPVNAMGVTCIHYFEHEWTEGCFGSAECADEDGKIYIIQNVIGGNLPKALTVAKMWYEHKINIGSSASPSPDYPIHMIYGISPSSVLVPIEDKTFAQNVFLKILYYGSQADKINGKEARYAAMLEIL